jgi:hypothetical protein
LGGILVDAWAVSQQLVLGTSDFSLLLSSFYLFALLPFNVLLLDYSSFALSYLRELKVVLGRA